MARKLAGEFPAKEAGAAMSAVAEPMVAKEEKWLPMEFNADGTPNTDCLAAPKVTEKTRVTTLPTGQQVAYKHLKYIKAGSPRYSVTDHGEVIAWFRKRGGVGRKWVYQFKLRYPDTPDGRSKQVNQSKFRAMLRARKIPGA